MPHRPIAYRCPPDSDAIAPNCLHLVVRTTHPCYLARVKRDRWAASFSNTVTCGGALDLCLSPNSQADSNMGSVGFTMLPSINITLRAVCQYAKHVRHRMPNRRRQWVYPAAERHCVLGHSVAGKNSVYHRLTLFYSFQSVCARRAVFLGQRHPDPIPHPVDSFRTY